MTVFIRVPEAQEKCGIPFTHQPLFVCYRGSQAHGTYVPPTNPDSIDDIDLMGVCIPGIENYMGLANWEGREHWEEGKFDIVEYEFRKYMRLMSKGNPNVLGTLWTRPDHFLYLHPLFSQLHAQRHLLLGKRGIYDAFVGYSRGQMKKMTAFSPYQGYMGVRRRALVDKFGHDTKMASHTIRLITMCIEFLETGEFVVYRENDAQTFIDIKQGKWDIKDVKDCAEHLFQKAELLYEKCPVPEYPDQEAVNKLSVNILTQYFMGFEKRKKF
jgi:predicted nucleotidyltransferase